MRWVLLIIGLCAATWALFIAVIWIVSMHPNGLPVLAAILLVLAGLAARSGDRYRDTTRRGVL